MHFSIQGTARALLAGWKAASEQGFDSEEVWKEGQQEHIYILGLGGSNFTGREGSDADPPAVASPLRPPPPKGRPGCRNFRKKECSGGSSTLLGFSPKESSRQEDRICWNCWREVSQDVKASNAQLPEAERIAAPGWVDGKFLPGTIIPKAPATKATVKGNLKRRAENWRRQGQW